MSKIVKGVFKGIKKIVKGVTKTFKSILKSPLGKALLLAAVIYTGGAALGYWQSPFASINGALTGGGVSESAAAAALEGGGAAGAAGATGTAAATEAAAAGAGAAGAGSATAAEIAASGAVPSIATSPAGYALNMSAAGTGAAKTGGLIASAMNNPLSQYALIQAGAGALESAFSPNEVDLMREQQRIRQEEIDRQNQNYNVGGIDVGKPGDAGGPQAAQKAQPPPPGFMYDKFGNLVPQPLPQQPRGFINTAMAR